MRCNCEMFGRVWRSLGPVHMVKKGHKYVTLLQIKERRGIYFEKGHNFVTNYKGDEILTICTNPKAQYG